jgi:hypothetical protein
MPCPICESNAQVAFCLNCIQTLVANVERAQTQFVNMAIMFSAQKHSVKSFLRLAKRFSVLNIRRSALYGPTRHHLRLRLV